MSNFQRALEIAVEAHAGQFDRAKQPYILHPLRLAMKMETEEERIVGVLHDVPEDCPDWPTLRLEKEGFSPFVIEALDLLNKPEGVAYENYIIVIKQNPLARKVKIADLEDNMDFHRYRHYDEKSLKNVQKYHEAWLVLKGFG